MNTLSYKTISANKETVKKEWVVVDATDQVLGRLGSKVAKLLRGKYKPNFTPHVDCGDNVIIINADKVKLTGEKNDRQGLHASHRIPRRPAFRYACRLSGQETDVHRRKSSQGHAAPHPSGRRAAQKPEGICRYGASARSAEPEDH